MKMNNNYSNKDKNCENSFFIDLSLLTDRQRKVIELVRRDFLPQVLKDQGLLEEIGNNKADLIEDGTERLIHNTEIVLKHYQRLQKIELKQIKLCESYMNEIDVYKRVIISEHIIATQYYLSTYFSALKDKLLSV